MKRKRSAAAHLTVKIPEDEYEMRPNYEFYEGVLLFGQNEEARWHQLVGRYLGDIETDQHPFLRQKLMLRKWQREGRVFYRY